MTTDFQGVHSPSMDNQKNIHSSAHWAWVYVPLLTLHTPSRVLERTGEIYKATSDISARGITPTLNAQERGYAEFMAVPTTADGTLFYEPSPYGDLLLETPLSIERHRQFLIAYRAIIESANLSQRPPSELRAELEQLLMRHEYPEIVDAYGGESQLLARSFPTVTQWLHQAGLSERGAAILEQSGVVSRFMLGSMDETALKALALHEKDRGVVMPYVTQAHQALAKHCYPYEDDRAVLYRRIMQDPCIQAIY